ncbi:hypothetical protein B0H19DRAFT_1242916 [Mycena capillaripes]|nr:hypothetical protein B0H19DRAFT_1242916 [Mycena capillaripes]
MMMRKDATQSTRREWGVGRREEGRVERMEGERIERMGEKDGSGPSPPIRRRDSWTRSPVARTPSWINVEGRYFAANLVVPEQPQMSTRNHDRHLADGLPLEIKNYLCVAPERAKLELGPQVAQMRMDPSLMRRSVERDDLDTAQHELALRAATIFRRLPPEILSKIFLSYVGLLGNKHDCMDVKHGAWLLTHVCGNWRAVALSTSRLWTRVFFSAPRTALCPYASHCSGDTSEYREHGPCRAVIGAFVTHCTQWSRLELEVPASFYSLPEMESFHNKIPLLRKLRIIAVPTSLFLPPLTQFSFAPRLCDVSLMSFDLWPVRVLLLWKQITSYSGPVVANPDILHDAPDLLACTFFPCSTLTTAPSLQSDRPICHNLHHLHLHSKSLNLEHITLSLPTLQSLRISAYDDFFFLRPIEALLQRSMAPLTSLHIDEFQPSHDLVAVFAAALSVTHLTLHSSKAVHFCFTQRLFTRFLGSGDTPPVLPALRALSLHGLTLGETIVRMTELRCVPPGSKAENQWVGARLESLTVSNIGDTHSSHLLRLEKLAVETGLKLVVKP